MSSSNDPMAAVRQYVDAFNNGDAQAMAAACADPMQILDGMSPHVWQGPTAAEDWWRDVLTEGEHLGASGYRIALGEPRHVDRHRRLRVCRCSRDNDVQPSGHASRKPALCSRWRCARSTRSGV